MFDIFGDCEYSGRNGDGNGRKLHKFRNKAVDKIAKQDILDREKALREAKKIARRQKLWSQMGIS